MLAVCSFQLKLRKKSQQITKLRSLIHVEQTTTIEQGRIQHFEWVVSTWRYVGPVSIDRRRREFLGGSEGMPPREILTVSSSEMWFPAFWAIMGDNFSLKIVVLFYIFFPSNFLISLLYYVIMFQKLYISLIWKISKLIV